MNPAMASMRAGLDSCLRPGNCLGRRRSAAKTLKSKWCCTLFSKHKVRKSSNFSTKTKQGSQQSLKFSHWLGYCRFGAAVGRGPCPKLLGFKLLEALKSASCLGELRNYQGNRRCPEELSLHPATDWS